MWLQLFAEQSDAVKLAIIGLVGGFLTGVFSFVKEWRKPALRAAEPPPQGRPIDATQMVIDELAGMQVHLAEISRLLKASSVEVSTNRDEDAENTRDQLDKLLSELVRIREEVIRNGGRRERA